MSELRMRVLIIKNITVIGRNYKNYRILNVNLMINPEKYKYMKCNLIIFKFIYIRDCLVIFLKRLKTSIPSRQVIGRRFVCVRWILIKVVCVKWRFNNRSDGRLQCSCRQTFPVETVEPSRKHKMSNKTSCVGIRLILQLRIYC